MNRLCVWLLVLQVLYHISQLEAFPGTLDNVVRNGPPHRGLPTNQNDQVHENLFNSFNGASLEYLPETCSPQGDTRANGLCANITKQLVQSRIGSGTVNAYEPPGLQVVDLHCSARGHLLGNQLGGTGKDVRNIVALYHRANNPLMKQWEDLTASAILVRFTPQPGPSGNQRSIQHIEYKVEVEYGATPRRHPTFIRLIANVWFTDGTRESWFDVRIPNEYTATRRDIDVRTDNTQGIFGIQGFDPNKQIKVSKTTTGNLQSRTSGQQGRGLIRGPIPGQLSAVAVLSCLCSVIAGSV